VVTNFLKFARPEQVSLALVDLEQIVQRAADDLQHELPAGTRVTVHGPFGEIQGDDVLLRQVFGNLVRNAVEACEIAGRVPEVTIRGVVSPVTGACQVIVDDNGPGIPESARDRVFQPFFTTRQRGTGLGLSIVQKVVVMHNGRITVGTSPSGGASMELAFPARTGIS
jgi:two-component system, NtrC family, sensor histidine kinase HydH